MSLLTTTDDVGGLLPHDHASLIIQPVANLSVALRVATLIDTANEQIHIPIIVDDAGAQWVDEAAEIPLDDPVLAELVIKPQKLAGLSSVSRELAEDSSPAAAQVVGQSIARSIAQRLDAAFFGNMAAPAPPGLDGLAGTTAVAAPSAFADLDVFASAISAAETVGATLTAFAANPADALELSTLKTGSGANSPLLGTDATSATDRQILGVPLLVSPHVTAGTLWGIPRDRTFVVRRTDVRVEFSPDFYFSSDRVAIRATMRAGFAFAHPAAVIEITKAAA